MFDIKTFGFDTMLNYKLFKKFKLIKRNKFNYLINNSLYIRKVSQFTKGMNMFLTKNERKKERIKEHMILASHTDDE
jgi:hypothetical protein